MSIERAKGSRASLSHWPLIAHEPTPLFQLPDLSRRLGVASISLKDESVRSPLGSFKALGAPIALVRLLVRLHPKISLAPEALFAGRHRELMRKVTVISATDGNHGRALAAAASSVGCRCLIVLHALVSVEREEAIAAHGAEIIRIKGNYDESVDEAARLATKNGWHVVSDTSYEGYEEIPRDVMQGYSVIADEIMEQTRIHKGGLSPFTHVFLQGGVGGLAAGVSSFLWEYLAANRPTFIVVEPEQADCLYQSALKGRAELASGSVDSVMAGLACGKTSPLAWRFLEPAIDYFVTVSDDEAVGAMKMLAAGSERDTPVVGGESGVAGVAGMVWLGRNEAFCRTAGLNADSRVLCINTEGATAPSVYEKLAGSSARSVLERQSIWNDQRADLNRSSASPY